MPDGVTSLTAVALVMSDNLGLGFTPVPQKVTTLCVYITVMLVKFGVCISHKSSFCKEDIVLLCLY